MAREMSQDVEDSSEASTSASSTSAGEADATPPAPILDEETRTRRLQEIHASVVARNARFEYLLSFIPPEYFQHLSDQEEAVIPLTKKERKADIANKERDVQQAREALKHERATARSQAAREKGKGRATDDSAPSVTRPVLSSPAPPSDGKVKPSISDLKARLDSKIQALQAARSPTREKLLADRKAKRERQAERKRQERKEARKAAKRSPDAPQAYHGPVDPPPAPSAEDAAVLDQVRRAGTTVTFGHLDFAPTSAVRPVDAERKRPGKDLRPSMSSHDPKQALAALQDRKRFLSTHSPQSRERAEERDRWTAMAARAEGGKVYDNEARLRKAIKKQDKLKKRSKQKWDDRTQSLEEARAARQKLRTENLARRRDEAKAKNRSKNKMRPGFEGGPSPKPKGAVGPHHHKPKRKETLIARPS